VKAARWSPMNSLSRVPQAELLQVEKVRVMVSGPVSRGRCRSGRVSRCRGGRR
jgi:hypothetical protein